ncbi:MAG: hypothetical protein AAFN79_01695 [Pseudomonadota bacterium]
MSYLVLAVALIYAVFLAVQLRRAGWLRFVTIGLVCAAIPVGHALYLGQSMPPAEAARALRLGFGAMGLCLVGAFLAILLEYMWSAIRGID